MLWSTTSLIDPRKTSPWNWSGTYQVNPLAMKGLIKFKFYLDFLPFIFSYFCFHSFSFMFFLVYFEEGDNTFLKEFCLFCTRVFECYLKKIMIGKNFKDKIFIIDNRARFLWKVNKKSHRQAFFSWQRALWNLLRRLLRHTIVVKHDVTDWP
jgi:hypothetical protein